MPPQPSTEPMIGTMSADLKRSILEVIKEYFDGSTHQLSNVDFDFPEVEVSFDPRNLLIPQKPIMVFLTNSSSNPLILKCSNNINPSLPAKEARYQVSVLLIIVSPRSDSKPIYTTHYLHKLWSLFHAVCECDKEVFLARRIRFPKLQAIPNDFVPDANTIAVSGSFDFEVTLNYASYNLL